VHRPSRAREIDWPIRPEYRIRLAGPAGFDSEEIMAKMDAGRIAYFEGNFVPIEDAKISILAHAFNYGTALFEGIRGYYNADEKKILIFRLQEHVDRIYRNSRLLCMEIPETAADIERICIETVRKSGF
jgi:branched-chain amino acid aminotransferase